MKKTQKMPGKLLTLSAALTLTFSASASVLLTDDFMVSSNSQNVNQQLAGRQTGPLAPADYTGWAIQHQVGNTTTGVGQPGGATNSDYVLLAFTGSFFSDLPIDAVASGPLTVQFDMYNTGMNVGGNSTDWGACVLETAGNCFPVAGTGQFGFLSRADGGMQVFNNGGSITPAGWDTPGFAPNPLWTLVFSDSTGTGSAFDGNGSQVTFINGTTTLGTVTLGQLNSAGLRLGWSDDNAQFAGIANLSISGTPGSLTPPGQNLSFEYDTTLSGTSINIVPTSWTAFNQNAPGDFGSQNAGGTDYTVFDPLAATAAGNQFCYINVFNGNPTGGIYQDMGPLQPNTIYTLTVAIGSRADRNNSPGVIALVNGTDNTGTVMATGGGLPPAQNTWQDYATTFSTGPSVSGDLTVVLSVLPAGTIQANFDNVRLTAQHSLVPLPILITNTTPASATLASGGNVVFTAAFSNSPPVSLQWQQIVSESPSVTNDITTGVVTVTNNGIVSSTLTINNVQLSNAGSYQLQAANATNFVTVVDSAPALLTVIPTITWYAAGAYNGGFSDDTVLALAGPPASEVYGVDFGGSGLLTTGNGYTFDDVSSGNITLQGTLTSFGGYLPGSATTGDLNLDTILNNGLYGTAVNTGTLNNLTVGQTYTVMVLLDDDRTSGAGGSTFDVTDGITVSPAQQYAYPIGVPEVGGYIMGTFTAQATTQPLTVLNNNGNSQYNAVLLMTGMAPPPTNPPVLTTDISPLLAEVSPGTPLILTVVAAGSTPLKYQWFNQGGPISGQTNASYSFNAVAGSNTFYVDVTNAFGSVDSSTNVVISFTNIVNVANFSFEAGTGSGYTPSSWTAFNYSWSGVYDENGANYPIFDPLAPPAQGDNFFACNTGPGQPTSGIYQVCGALQPNTTYTLTVAIGYSQEAPVSGQSTWSPGIISLIKGNDNTGAILASGGGIPATPGTWQDYTVTYTTGASVSGNLTVELAVAAAPTYQAQFDNVRLTKAPASGPPAPPAIHNPSFEAGTGSVPSSWAAFNDSNFSIVTEASPGEYAAIDPLAFPADGTNFFAINEGPADPTGGIYQEYDVLQPNTIYTLTVAIGFNGDNGPVPGEWSPGIISLINGDDNTGTVLASTSGIGSVPGAWQDFTTTYTTGPSVSGDLTVELSVAPAPTYQANFDNVRLTLTPAPGMAPTVSAQVSGGNLVLTGGGGSTNCGYTLLTTTNLAAPVIWTTNSAGNLDGTGAFSNSIPIGTVPASFYRIRVP
jgi:hypothetical protein